MTNPEIYWTGKSGIEYGYWIHPIGTEFRAEAGNYIYAVQTASGSWRPLYIGQTSNLQARLAGHERRDVLGGTALRTFTLTRHPAGSVRDSPRKRI